MISFKDRAFCASPNCKNECGRKMTNEEHEEYKRANLPENWDGMLGVAYSYFCNECEHAFNQPVPLIEDDGTRYGVKICMKCKVAETI